MSVQASVTSFSLEQLSPPHNVDTTQSSRASRVASAVWTVCCFPRDSVQVDRFGRRATQLIRVPPGSLYWLALTIWLR